MVSLNPVVLGITLLVLGAGAILGTLRRNQADDKGISIEKEVEPNLPPVLGDVERIHWIFDNLLQNAYLYNLQGGPIIARMHQVEDEVQVDVKDTGLGIHPDDQDPIFERFFRGESPLVLGVSGTGLVLAIVRNLVEMLNVRIWLTSSGIAGEGSAFSSHCRYITLKDDKVRRCAVGLRSGEFGWEAPTQTPPKFP